MSDSQENKQDFTGKDWTLMIFAYIGLWFLFSAALESLLFIIGFLLAPAEFDFYELIYFLVYAGITTAIYFPLRRKLDLYQAVKSERSYNALWWVLVLILVLTAAFSISSFLLALTAV